MKIGIITFHDTTNFGSLLQTFGLYKAIVNLGYDCEVIDYKCDEIVRRELPPVFEFSLSIRKIIQEVFFNRRIRNKYNEFARFMADNMNLSKSYTRDDIKQSVSSYDKIIVGSDIVWGLDITNSDLTYFLDFVSDKKKKYAFSSSIGSEWSQSEQLIVGPLLRDFNRIAVREEQAVKWVYEASGFRADLVCDPTMLLPGSEWAKYASNIGANQKYVLVYFDTQNRDCLKKAGILAKKYNLKIVLINYWRPVWGVCNMAPTAPENFIGLFKNASFVVTASYHGLLFSTYFQREVIYYNRAHKSRMSSLGDILGISDRDGTSNIEFDKMDYSSINNRLEQFRNSSLSILTEMLHD